MNNFDKRLSEVDEILKYLPYQYKKNIPNEILYIIKNNKDKNYHYKYNSRKKLYEQNIPKDTIAILSYINTEYILSNPQKDFVKQMHLQNDLNIQTEINSNINLNSNILFKGKNKTSKTNNTIIIAKTNNLNFFIKIINKLKDFFHKI